MKATPTELAARVDASRRPDHAEPWMPAVAGTHFYLLISAIEAAALAEGIVLHRTRKQAADLIRYLESTETP
jgi:hypothetical protein